jgi:hypothetical protein
MSCRYKAYYFEDFPINRLTLCDAAHLYKEGVKTGGMSLDEFYALKDNIEEHGQRDPIVVEVDSGNPPRYRICMGNNRVEALISLEKTHVRALVLHRARVPMAEDGAYEKIKAENLDEFMAEVHPGNDWWKKSSWATRILRSAT